MIVPMKKAAVIVQAKDADEAVGKLGGLGLLHIEHQQLPQGKDITSLKDDITVIAKVIDILSAPDFTGRRGFRSAKRVGDWRHTGRHIADLYCRIDQLGEYSRRMKNDIIEWEKWGDFDPEAVRSLEEKGIFVGLYQVPEKEMVNISPDVVVKKFFSSAGIVNCALISLGKKDLPFKNIGLPKMSLSRMRDRVAEDFEVVRAIKDCIRKYTIYRERFIKIREAFEKELEFHEAVTGMGRSGEISYITGYVPFDAVDELTSAAKAQRWGVSISNPSDYDRVPTLIRNPRWVSIIAPVFKVIEIVPGYKELDISMWFLLFFSVFFGMLIGDAGYGAIFFILTLAAQMKFGKRVADKAPFVLLYMLSSCAIIWGVLSGTFFGQEWLPPSVKPILPALRNDRSLQVLCFFIGALQLSIGHMWRALLKWPSLACLADAGWAMVLWGGFFLAKMLILSDAFPGFAKWFFIIGVGLVLLFTKPNRNPLKAIGSGMGNLALNFINSFTDVVSYIRLFAVGLATVAVADSFNNMAMDVGYNSIVTGFVACVILIVGHTLNMLLGPLSIIVHGVRLNVLEFCSHVDIKWSGFSYNPLKAKSVVNNKS